jgi:hypothetical protein
MSLVENGILTIPLYHGTSSLFIDSIIDKGLGGIDPLDELGAREFGCKMFDLCDRYLCRDEKWKSHRGLVEATVKQESIGGGLNYKHGESYLALAPDMAISYACSQRYGSEFLTTSIRMYILLKYKNVVDLSCFDASPMMKLLDVAHHPILLTLNNVKIKDIDTETDRILSQQLEEIEIYMKKNILRNLNFKLKVPVYKENFTVTKISCDSISG